jgi:hypothetical protein
VARSGSVHNSADDIGLGSYVGKDITISEAVIRRRDKVDALKESVLL